MKILFILLLLPLQAIATPFDNWECSSQILKLTKDWKATGDWEKKNVNGLESAFYASPTNIVGQWVLVARNEKGIGLSKASQEGRLEVSFEAGKCKPNIKPFTNPKPSSTYFTDQNLKEFIQKKKTGIIYVWSPRMHLSQNGLAEIKKAAELKKLPLLVLISKDIDTEEHAKLKSSLGEDLTHRVDSFDFKMRNVDQHYPAIMVFKNNIINTRVKYGHEKAEGYLRDINELLSH